ncbi:hypothetical protein Sste5346_004529 [Sporothrix stenoceras]|uniref:Impact N-terminal domain-containing protein n=1 Tax=Sporothrix stenoceras TaxID=5173 RepID=A0ABR3Z805_9PEZI
MSASEKDLQELLRLLTTTRKLPILQAMTQAPADVVKDAIKDAAAAKSLQTSCKTALKKMAAGGSAGSKRIASAAAGSSSAAKRAKQLGGTAAASRSDNLFMGPEPMTAAELERSLELPVFVPTDEEDEERIASTVLMTNRAPLVLAFAVELLRYTMPEQPVSSRLSLAQAVVSANSRSKATSLGMEWAKGPSADDAGWGQGQPRVRILGREVAVLKRSGYTWKGDEEEQEGDDKDKEPAATQAAETDTTVGDTTEDTAPPQSTPQVHNAQSQPAAGIWSNSQTISLKDSTFVARATTITDPGQRAGLLRSLMETHPKLLTATHNAWAYRVRSSYGDHTGSVRQDSYDDGETGCGDLMLRVLHELGAVDTLVVLTRWFGGTMLGPDRWRLMRNCVTGVMAERLRRTGADVALGGEAAWGLDLEAMREQQEAGTGGGSGSNNNSAAARFKHGPSSGLTSVVGMPIHRPEGARQYLMKSFLSAEDTGSSTETTPTKKKKTVKAMDAEKEENLSLLLGALRMVFDSWADHVTAAELDRRAWGWYVAVRPEVEAGPSGWGAKGTLKLKDILALRRPEPKTET